MRKILLFVMAVFTAATMHAETIYGNCGEDMEWEFNTGSGALYLIGTGPMDDYLGIQAPWAAYRNQIRHIYADSRSQYTSIGKYAFFNYMNLESVELPNTVMSIKEDAFGMCYKLSEITFSNGLKYIGEYAFTRCAFTSIEIPGAVEEIGRYAFWECEELATVSIQSAILGLIGRGAFGKCSKLTSISVAENNGVYTSVNGVLLASGNEVLHTVPAGLSGTFTIPSTVNTIAESAFAYCQKITDVVFPANSYWEIDFRAFIGCTMPSIELPEGLETLESETFKDATINSITLPSTFKEIYYNPFTNCTQLTSITCKATTPPTCHSALEGFDYSSCTLYVPASSVNTYKSTEPWSNFGNNILPIEDVSGICGKNGEGNLADNLTWTFDSETGTLTIEGSGEMMDYEFEGAPWRPFSHLTNNIVLPDGLTSIGDYAFLYFQTLPSIIIPEGVTSIGNGAFQNCNNLLSANIPSSVTSIGAGAFYWCGISSINIPEGVTIINDFTFHQCFNLTSINIPEGVASIGMYVFRYCEDLASVTIPTSVTSIGDAAFYDCLSLKEITNYATTPQTLGWEVFDQVDKANCKLYVPSSAVEAYKAAEVWKEFDIKVAQGIEDIAVPTGDAQKILMDGVLLIERNGKTYSAQGAEVK